MNTLLRRSARVALTVCAALPACAVDASDPGTVSSADAPIIRAPDGTVSRGGVRYLPTPRGYVAEGCVHGVGDNAMIERDGTVTEADGTHRALAACAHPMISSRGAEISEDAAAAPSPSSAPTINGWVEAATWTTPRPIGHLVAAWHVPPAPAHWAGELIYFFPGMEPLDGSVIVQPVLQYGVSPAGGGAYWGIASWAVGGPAGAIHSPLRRVNPGDALGGSIDALGCNSAGACFGHRIVTADWNNGANTTLNQAWDGRLYRWAQAGVLEVYNVTRCDELPAWPAVLFDHLDVLDTDGRAMGAGWAPTYWDTTGAGRCPTPFLVRAYGTGQLLQY